jgi:hypothetical protein
LKLSTTRSLLYLKLLNVEEPAAFEAVNS